MAVTDHSIEATPPVPDTPGTPDAVWRAPLRRKARPMPIEPWFLLGAFGIPAVAIAIVGLVYWVRRRSTQEGDG